MAIISTGKQHKSLGEDEFIVCYHLRILISTALAFCALCSCLGGADVIAQKALSSEGEFICPIYILYIEANTIFIIVYL